MGKNIWCRGGIVKSHVGARRRRVEASFPRGGRNREYGGEGVGILFVLFFAR